MHEARLERVGADRKAPLLAVETDRRRSAAHGEKTGVAGLLRQAMQAFRREAQEPVPGRCEGSEHIGFFADIVAPVAVVLLQETGPDQGEQEAANRRFVETALLDDGAQGHDQPQI